MKLKSYIIDSIPKLNEVFIGGITEGSMIHLYGPFQSGKSLLLIQILYEFVGKKFGNALYIDTEASIRNNFESIWLDRFRDRFKYEVSMEKVNIEKYTKAKGGKKKFLKEIKAIFEDVFTELNIDVDDILLDRALRILTPNIVLSSEKSRFPNKIYILESVDLPTILTLLNIKADIKRVGDKIEVKIKGYEDVLSSPISIFIDKYKIKFLVIDSLGTLIKPLMSSLQDLPARANVTNMILTGLMRLVSDHKLIVFVSNHESKSPIKSSYYTFYGGSPIGYSFKYSIYLKRIGVGEREIIAYRAPHIPEKSWSLKLVIKDDGFHEARDK